MILLPGRSQSGKSTLVRELIRAGAAYFSDEYAALDENGMVHPFARPLSLRSHNGRTLYDPRQNGERVGANALPVGLVAITRHVPLKTWRPAPVTPGRALLEIANNTVSIRANPARALRILRIVVSNAPAFMSPRGEAVETAPVLLEAVERSNY